MVERLLARVPIFASLPRREIKRLAGTLPRIELPPGTVLIHEGDVGDRFYIVLEGELEIIKGLGTAAEQLLNVQMAGEYIGEMSFLSPHSLRTASVRTRTDVCLLEMTGGVFQGLLQKWPSIALEIARKVSQRLLASEEKSARDLYEKEDMVAETLSDYQSTLLPLLELAKSEDESGKQAGLISGIAELRKSILAKSKHLQVEKEHKDAGSAAGPSPRPRIHIKTLGGFQLFRGAAAFGKAEWGGNQPQLLLKAIIARDAVSVPKDVLIEDLWPEIDPVAGTRNFKVTLHRLRKALEPAADRATGSSYVHLRNQLVSLDEHLCHVDVDEFVSCCRRGRKNEEARNVKEALASYENAVAVYEGDFLVEDLYAPWAAVKREKLRQQFLEMLYRLGALYETAGTFKGAVECYTRIVYADPTSEQAYQKLMIAYAGRGMRSAALRVYEDCRKVLKEELGADPDDLTDSIYRKLLESY